MKNLLILLALIVIIGAAFGLYRGWFSLSSDNDEGNPSITVSVDKDKIEADKDKAMGKVQDMGDKTEDKTAPTPPKPQQ